MSAGGNTTVDGANGCVTGRELVPISYTGEDANVMGIDKHQLNNLPICTCAGVHDLSDGTPILCIFNRYAYHADGNTIHSKIQLQDNGNFVDDCPTKLGGTQKIVTPGGITMALNVIPGLASLRLRRPTDDELATLEPVHMTKDVPWNPSKYDSAPSIDEDWFAAFTDFYSLLPATEILRNHNNISVFGADSTLIPRDYDSLRPYFLGMPSDVVRLTYDATTQYYSNYSDNDSAILIIPTRIWTPV